MKRAIIVGFAVLFVTATAWAATPAMKDTKHDLTSWYTGTSEICVFCHTPHQPDGTTTDPLFNHSLSGNATYGTYASDTFDGSTTISDIGGGTSVSVLCMSCHDGTVAIGALKNEPNSAWSSTVTASTNVGSDGKIKNTASTYLGTDLSNDHPVNFDYDAVLVGKDDELVTPDSDDWVDAAKTVPLFNKTVQCASCHDPHEATNDTFLVVANTESNLCVECHIK